MAQHGIGGSGRPLRKGFDGPVYASPFPKRRLPGKRRDRQSCVCAYGFRFIRGPATSPRAEGTDRRTNRSRGSAPFDRLDESHLIGTSQHSPCRHAGSTTGKTPVTRFAGPHLRTARCPRFPTESRILVLDMSTRTNMVRSRGCPLRRRHYAQGVDVQPITGNVLPRLVD